MLAAACNAVLPLGGLALGLLATGLAFPATRLDATVTIYGGIVAVMAAAAALFRKFGTDD